MLTRALAKLKTFRRFGRSRRGSAAVEFAIVVVPFFLLTVGLAEISMIGFAQTSLDFAVSESARQIRTGQAQMGGLDGDDIHDLLCTELTRFMALDCQTNLYLDVKRFDAFTDVNSANPIQNGQFQDPGFGYAPGAPSDIVVVRAFYRWEIMTPMFEPVFENIEGGERVMVSTMMFRNEPYQ
jgi:Flp pilus assembly protein TadG